MSDRSQKIQIARMAAAILFCLPGLGSAQPPKPHEIVVEVKDLSPKFLAFYDAAVAEKAGPERRFQLWKEKYGFAALPPVPERDEMARKLLDTAWQAYPEVLDRIRAGAVGMRPEPEPVLREVAAKLGADRPLTVKLLAYVGAREKNAFFFPQDGSLNLAVPVEEAPEWRELVMVHEMTHAVNHALAGFSEGWERTIARTLFAEGLAMRVTESLRPGRGEAAYVGEPDWLAAAQGKHREILEGLRPHLRAKDSATVVRFTMGKGTTGLERESYYAGWLVVGHLLGQGKTFAELARLQDEQIPEIVEKALGEMLAGP
jgi:hypothetical protein